MRRRQFIALFGGAAALLLPPSARAQQADKLPTIGILGSTSAAWSHWLGALLQHLQELGWIENRTVAINYAWTEGNNRRYAELAAGLASRKVDVIVPLGTPAIVAAKKTTPPYLSSSHFLPTPSAKAWLLLSPIRAATSLDCRISSPTSSASGSKFCAISFTVFASSRFSPVPTIPPPSCR